MKRAMFLRPVAMTLLALLALMALVACGRSVAAGEMLFQASSFLSQEDEARLLTKDEKKSIDETRAHWRIKGVRVTRFDASVIGEPTITVEMPDHRVYRFEGSLADRTDPSGYFTWSGKAKAETGSATVTPAQADAEVSAGDPPSADTLTVTIDRGWTTMRGTLVADGREFSIGPLNPKFLQLTERGLNASAPPIDAEPPGPRPTRPPRSGPDWPAGALTDELKASISTSSIGRSLQPGYCNKVTSCGTVTRISCHPEWDGHEMFFNNKTGVLIMACGGTCMGGAGLPGSKRCTACPPPEWSSCRGADEDR